MSKIFILLFFGLSLIFGINQALAEEYNVGYKSYSMWKQRDYIRLDISLWFPTTRSPSRFHLDDYLVSAAKNAPIQKIIDEEKAKPFRDEISSLRQSMEKNKSSEKEITAAIEKIILPHIKFPLIILSHDSIANRYTYHTLAAQLAKMGYLVAIPSHFHDNSYAMTYKNYPISLLERAKQILATLDFFLSDDYVADFIDQENITYLGFGNAGMAAMLLQDVDFTTDKWETYCQAFTGMQNLISEQVFNPLTEHKKIYLENQSISVEFENIDPYCFEPLYSNLNTINHNVYELKLSNTESQKFYEALLSKTQAKLKETNQDLEQEAKKSKSSNIPPFVQPFLPPFKANNSYENTSFSKFIYVSPGLYFLFDQDDLAKINKPTLFIGLLEDKINLPQFQSERFYAATNEQYSAYQVLTNVDSFGLQAPCPENELLIEICRTVSEEQREQSLLELSTEINNFIH